MLTFTLLHAYVIIILISNVCPDDHVHLYVVKFYGVERKKNGYMIKLDLSLSISFYLIHLYPDYGRNFQTRCFLKFRLFFVNMWTLSEGEIMMRTNEFNVLSSKIVPSV